MDATNYIRQFDTHFDRRPSHPVQPDPVREARQKAEQAWFWHRTACAQFDDGVGSQAAVSVLLEAAVEADRKYAAEWTKANTAPAVAYAVAVELDITVGLA